MGFLLVLFLFFFPIGILIGHASTLTTSYSSHSPAQTAVSGDGPEAGVRVEPVKCFRQVPIPLRPLIRPVVEDCNELVSIILRGDKRDAPMLFSRFDGFIVPHLWDWRTCRIMINVKSMFDQDTFSITQLMIRAMHIVMACIVDATEEFGLGGIATAGPTQVVSLTLIGIKAAEHVWPLPNITFLGSSSSSDLDTGSSGEWETDSDLLASE